MYNLYFIISTRFGLYTMDMKESHDILDMVVKIVRMNVKVFWHGQTDKKTERLQKVFKECIY